MVTVDVNEIITDNFELDAKTFSGGVAESSCAVGTSRAFGGGIRFVNPFAAVKRFFTSEIIGTAPMDDAFIQIDRDGMAKTLNLQERGRENGELNQPPPTATVMDVVENDIIAQINSELTRAQINARTQCQAYENRLADLRLLHEVGTIKAEAAKALGDFDTLVIDWRNRLSNLRDKIVASYRDLETFKAKNHLTRPAHDKPASIVTWSGFAVSFLLEVVGNALFLRVNDDLGYLGGLIAAIMVAAINVGVGISVGFLLWPRTKVRADTERTVAWVGIGLWVVFLLVWNLFAAHFRDAKSLGADDPQSAAVQTLLASPLSLEGIYSWGLFIIGILAAVVGARTAYRADDPFPGYGERDRNHRARCEEYADGVAEANRQLTGVRDDAIQGATDVKRQLGLQSQERGRIRNAHNRFARRYQQHQDHIEIVANYLLSIYRNANRGSRTEPSPAYFDNQWELNRSDVEPLHDPQLPDTEIKSAEDALSACIDNVAAAFTDAIGKFEPLEKLKAELQRGHI